jgi:rsbT co-antagonist protein RsbR
MTELSRTTGPQLMLEMGLTDAAIERRKQLVALDDDDRRRIATIREPVLEHLEAHTEAFFAFLDRHPEADGLTRNRAVLERARRWNAEHLVAMLGGEYGRPYVEQRIELALLFGAARLEPRLFLGAFHHLRRSVGAAIARRFVATPLDGFDAFMSFEKVALFDVSLIVDVIVFGREGVIREQQRAIRELSTPVLQMSDRQLLIPIVGVLDRERAALLTDGLLRSVQATRARVVVMDVTGVATIDTQVASYLLQVVTAAKMMGATVVVTGLSSNVAQSLVGLGVDLTALNPVGDLRGGLEAAARLLDGPQPRTRER